MIIFLTKKMKNAKCNLNEYNALRIADPIILYHKAYIILVEKSFSKTCILQKNKNINNIQQNLNMVEDSLTKRYDKQEYILLNTKLLRMIEIQHFEKNFLVKLKVFLLASVVR